MGYCHAFSILIGSETNSSTIVISASCPEQLHESAHKISDELTKKFSLDTSFGSSMIRTSSHSCSFNFTQQILMILRANNAYYSKINGIMSTYCTFNTVMKDGGFCFEDLQHNITNGICTSENKVKFTDHIYNLHYMDIVNDVYRDIDALGLILEPFYGPSFYIRDVLGKKQIYFHNKKQRLDVDHCMGILDVYLDIDIDRRLNAGVEFFSQPIEYDKHKQY